MLWVLLVFAVSLIATYALTPLFIRKLRERGVLGEDVHKEQAPRIPEMGGFVLLFGFSAGMLIAIPFFPNGLSPLFAGFLTVLLTGLVGLVDDFFGMRQKIKAFLPLFAAVPLMAIQAGVSSIILPFYGLVEFGVLYALIIIPLEVAVLSNATNMLAGYNGLEAGLGAIASIFLALAGVIIGNSTVVVIMLSMAAACIAFLRFNYFPAKVFMGDVGSFTIGSSLAVAIIIGNLEMVGGIIVAPYIINGLMTVIDLIRGKPIEKFASLRDGILVPPEKKYVQNLYYWLERHGTFSEKKLVTVFWVIGILCGVLGIGFLLAQGFGSFVLA